MSVRPATRAESPPGEAPWLWGMSRYQWLVLFAAWLGWGFDVFDGLLFNLVAPVCVPRLLGVAASDARVGAATGARRSRSLHFKAISSPVRKPVRKPVKKLARSCSLLALDDRCRVGFAFMGP